MTYELHHFGDSTYEFNVPIFAFKNRHCIKMNGKIYTNHLEIKTKKKPIKKINKSRTLTPHKEQARRPPRGVSKQGNLLFVRAPRCCSGGPHKALPEKKKKKR